MHGSTSYIIIIINLFYQKIIRINIRFTENTKASEYMEVFYIFYFI